MDLAPVWDQLAHSIAQLPKSGLLMAAVAAVLAGAAGSLIIRRSPALGRLLRVGSTLVLSAILVLVVLQLSRMDPRFEMAVPELGLPEQEVAGGETRVPRAPEIGRETSEL